MTTIDAWLQKRERRGLQSFIVPETGTRGL